jgi:hypothetical protein
MDKSIVELEQKVQKGNNEWMRKRTKTNSLLKNAGSIKFLTTEAKMRINEIFNIRQNQVVEHERRGRVERKGL